MAAGMKAAFDTNILIDALKGLPQARAEFALYDEKCISVITWMEVMAGVRGDEEAPIRRWLAGFTLLPVDARAMEAGTAIRQRYRIALPDAIVLASARTAGLQLVTRNTKDFNPSVHPDVRVPYVLSL
jgi:predicted nucleic acid-binding protein